MRDHEWYDEFWGHLGDDDDGEAGVSALRLIGELFDEFVIERDGDDILGASGNSFTPDTADHHLIRRIEDAARAARMAVGS